LTINCNAALTKLKLATPMSFTQSTFLISIISVLIGTLTYYKTNLLLSSNLEKKGQKFLTQLAAISIAVGVGFISNEILSSVVLGLIARQDFILWKVITNLFFIPSILLGIVWINGGYREKKYDEKNEIKFKAYVEIEKEDDKNNEVEIDYSLNFSLFKEKYGINDYDLAKAKNELQGIIPNVKANIELIEHCRKTTDTEKEAEKKYILTRAYQISKSSNRNEPHNVSVSASEAFKNLGIYRNEKSTINEQHTNLKSKANSNTIFLWDTSITVIMIVVVGVIFYNIFFSTNKEIEKKEEQKISTTEQTKEKPNFYNSDMSYILKNCQSNETDTQAYEFEKLRTSINDRDAILIGKTSKIYFEQCFLNGRYYQCKTKYEKEQILKITFDVIEQYYWHEEIDVEDDKKINKSIECQVR
jgi:hypothetical protein